MAKKMVIRYGEFFPLSNGIIKLLKDFLPFELSEEELKTFDNIFFMKYSERVLSTKITHIIQQESLTAQDIANMIGFLYSSDWKTSYEFYQANKDVFVTTEKIIEKRSNQQDKTQQVSSYDSETMIDDNSEILTGDNEREYKRELFTSVDPNNLNFSKWEFLITKIFKDVSNYMLLKIYL